MSTRTEFNRLFKEWKKYCSGDVRFSSNPMDYLNCDAYRGIVAMGPAVLPLIREAYSKGEDINTLGFGSFSSIISQVVGDDFKIPEEIHGHRDRTRKFSMQWLDKNMHRYL